MVKLAIIVINYKTKDLTLNCLKSIYANDLPFSYQVWLVDNASGDDSVDAVKKEFPQAKIIESDKNLGFAGGNNLALKKAEAEYYLLLNSDTIVKDHALEKLVDFADSNHFDIVSGKLLNPDNTFQPNAGELPNVKALLVWLSGLDDILGKILSLSSYQERKTDYYQNGKKVGWVGGTAMLINQKVLKEIGLLDENIFMYGEDVEYCFRSKKAGFSVGWTNQTEIVHLGGASSKTPKFNQWLGEFRGLLYLYQKYYGSLSSLALKLLFYIFIFLRVVAFAIIGKVDYARTYVQILTRL